MCGAAKTGRKKTKIEWKANIRRHKEIKLDFRVLPSPLFLSLSPGEHGGGRGRGQVKGGGWAAAGRSWLDTRKGWLPRGTVMRGGRREAEREG